MNVDDGHALVEHLVAWADTAMYEAKGVGGHQIRWAATRTGDTSEHR
jgi:hypothetical protein